MRALMDSDKALTSAFLQELALEGIQRGIGLSIRRSSIMLLVMLTATVELRLLW